MNPRNTLIALLISLALVTSCQPKDRRDPDAQSARVNRTSIARTTDPALDEAPRVTPLNDPELDAALEADDETEAAERESRAQEAQEARAAAATRPRTARKSWDVRIDRPLTTAPTTRPTTSPSGMLDQAPIQRGLVASATSTTPAAQNPIRASILVQSSLKQITLRRDFVEKYKNRVTITSPVRVVHAGNVHSAATDGDQHIAVLADEVNLAACAEIMNARNEPVVQAMKSAAESQDVIAMSGAWRLWCEHPGNEPHIQDDPIPAYPHSNPDHVFEIHPVHRAATADGTFDLHHTLRPIQGYTTKPASTFKTIYEKLPCRIEFDDHDQTITLFTKKVGYNYVKFILEVDDDQQFLTLDGRIVRCNVLNLNRNTVVKSRRMVFIKDTPPEIAVRNLSRGDQLTVVGMPRIDLALVSWRVRNAVARPEALQWNLPYEIVVCGVYDNN